MISATGSEVRNPDTGWWRRSKPRVLAIDPGTKEMGIAVLDGAALAYHGVKVFKKGKSPFERLRQARQAVVGLVRDFRPDVLALEKTFVGNNRSVCLLNVLGDEIRAVAREERAEFVSYAPSTIRKAVTGNGWSDKGAVAAAVVRRYPELRAYSAQDRKWRQRLHGHMFDAVALGMLVTSRREIGRG
ncbi:MAG: crossover junction endodeoxyribonuclease RuvC [Armatimonadetes bacterium]|nr:crossover junction endodeoxyribonuclease RuvC [Armatimonadota bacterium]